MGLVLFEGRTETCLKWEYILKFINKCSFHNMKDTPMVVQFCQNPAKHALSHLLYD